MNLGIKLAPRLLAAALCLVGAGSPLAAQESSGKKVEQPIKYVMLAPDPLVGDWAGAGGMVAQVYKTPAGD